MTNTRPSLTTNVTNHCTSSHRVNSDNDQLTGDTYLGNYHGRISSDSFAFNQVLPLCRVLIFLSLDDASTQNHMLDIEMDRPSSTISSSACIVITYWRVLILSRICFKIRSDTTILPVQFHGCIIPEQSILPE